MKLGNFYSDAEYSYQEVIKKTPVVSDRMRLIMIYMEKNQKLTPHLHENSEELFFVVSGSGVIYIGDEVIDVKEGDVVHVINNTMHSIESRDGQLSVYAVQAPRP
jgi:mannose-6-phosphate isomerase-like protein (cupin superfamily)